MGAADQLVPHIGSRDTSDKFNILIGHEREVKYSFQILYITVYTSGYDAYIKKFFA